MNWTNAWNLGDGWDLRAITIGGLEIGDGREDNILLETRIRLNRKLSGTTGPGVEVFNSYGSTATVPDFDKQEHAFGPLYIYEGRPNPQTTLRLGAVWDDQKHK